MGAVAAYSRVKVPECRDCGALKTAEEMASRKVGSRCYGCWLAHERRRRNPVKKPRPRKLNCRDCGNAKTQEELATHALGARCRPCKTVYNRMHFKRWNERNPGALAASKKRWCDRNPEKVKHKNRVALLRRKYGMTVEQYNGMAAAQGHGCAICGAREQLHVDHCHETGTVRCLLCTNCNKAIGMLKEDVNIMTSAIEYVKFYGAKKRAA